MKSKNSVYNKIKSKTLLISLVSVFCVGLASIFGMSYMRINVTETSENLGLSAALDSKKALTEQAEEALLRLAESKAEISDGKLSAVSEYVEIIAMNSTQIESNAEMYKWRFIDFPNADNSGTVTAQLRLAENVSANDLKREIGLISNIQDLLVALCSNHESVRSAYIGTESGISISADGDSAEKTNIYDPRTRPWYMEAKEKNTLVWTDVFYDNSGRGLAITCAKPFYNAAGEMTGVAGVGMTLQSLTDIIIETKIGETGRAFIINEKGEVIISDKITENENGEIIKENLTDDNGFPDDTITRILNGESGIEHININGTEHLLAFEPLKTLPWSLAIIIDSDEVITPALESEMNIISMKDDAMKNIDMILTFMFFLLSILLIIVEIFTFILTKNLAGKLAAPIIKLSKDAEIIGAGNFDYKPVIKTGDEIETLADAFILMIENIKRITSEKERIGAELDVAAKIQAGMLPSIFPPFPDRNDFEIFASMRPAKEVGGDFYDFFMVDEKTLAIVIADVSGKGVPAALFMVIAKTVIKNNAQLGKSPRDVFEKANAVLCENNDENMFVTAFMGYLDLTAGTLTYVNAGHNPPIIVRRNGVCEFIQAKSGFVLAGMEKMRFSEGKITLGKESMLFLYTDGVTEAVNEKKEMLTEEKLLDICRKYNNCKTDEMIKRIKDEIDIFAGNAEQADDITMLAVKIANAKAQPFNEKVILGKISEGLALSQNADTAINTLSSYHDTRKCYDLRIAAESENLGTVLDFIEDKLAENGYTGKKKNMIKIAAEEIFINIARYAYSPGKGDAVIRIGVENDVFLEFEDSGVPYNPLKMPDPDITLSADKRKIGGLGVYMAKNFASKAEYCYNNGRNILRLLL